MIEFLQQLINGLSVGAIYALIAVGYTMVYGVLRLINFAHGDIFMIGAVMALFVATGRIPPVLPWWFHLIIASAVAAVAAVWLIRDRLPPREVAKRLIFPAGFYLIATIALFVISKASHGGMAPNSWMTTLFMVVVAITACGVFGFLAERLAYRPLRDKPRINSLITAIGLSLFIEFGGQHRAIFGPTPKAFPVEVIPNISQPLFSSANISVGRVDLIVIVVTLVLMLFLTWLVLKTKIGLALRAVSHRFDTASLMGVNVDRVISFTFILGSCLAAVAGILFSIKYPKVEPLMGLLPGIKAFVAAVLGGIGNIGGAVVGGLLLGMIEVLAVGYLPNGSQYKDGIAFVILIAILLVKPSGLLGKNVVEKV